MLFYIISVCEHVLIFSDNVLAYFRNVFYYFAETLCALGTKVIFLGFQRSCKSACTRLTTFCQRKRVLDMSVNVCRRLVNKIISFRGSGSSALFLRGVTPLLTSERQRMFCESAGEVNFDTSLLEFLVCPLSKNQLR